MWFQKWHHFVALTAITIEELEIGLSAENGF
jgi:hypothetical protein